MFIVPPPNVLAHEYNFVFLVGSLVPIDAKDENASPLLSLAIQPGGAGAGDGLVAVGSRGAVYLLNAQGSKSTRIVALPRRNQLASALAFSPENPSLLAVGCFGGELFLADTRLPSSNSNGGAAVHVAKRQKNSHDQVLSSFFSYLFLFIISLSLSLSLSLYFSFSFVVVHVFATSSGCDPLWGLTSLSVHPKTLLYFYLIFFLNLLWLIAGTSARLGTWDRRRCCSGRVLPRSVVAALLRNATWRRHRVLRCSLCGHGCTAVYHPAAHALEPAHHVRALWRQDRYGGRWRGGDRVLASWRATGRDCCAG